MDRHVRELRQQYGAVGGFHIDPLVRTELRTRGGGQIECEGLMC